MIGFGYTDATNTNSPAYIGYEETSTSGDTKGVLTFYTRDVITDTAPTERMRIDSSGNVGIGETSPDGELHVTGTGGGNGDMYVERTSGAKIHLQAQSANGKIGTSSNHNLGLNTNGTTRLTLDTSGNMLVGKSSSTGVATNNIEISHSSSASEQIEGGTNEWSMLVSSSTDALRFYQDSIERMRISPNGSVLIGTTTDVAESQLNGALKLGIGVNTGIGIKRLTVGTSATTVFNLSDFAPSDSSGDGLYMFNIVRTGGSYGTRFVGILGVDNAAIAVVETLESLGFTISVSGMNLQASAASAVSCIATLQPLAIGE